MYPAVVEICINIRKAILRYGNKPTGEDETEDIMTLRTMLNMQGIYELEMKRELGLKDEYGNPYSKVPNGKTLRDAIESYFMAMNKEKAAHIKSEVNLEGFLNSYKGSVMKEKFMKEYTRRAG